MSRHCDTCGYRETDGHAPMCGTQSVLGDILFRLDDIEQRLDEAKTEAEESLILAAIDHVKRLGLTGGPLTEAVREVERERRQ